MPLMLIRRKNDVNLGSRLTDWILVPASIRFKNVPNFNASKVCEQVTSQINDQDSSMKLKKGFL